MEGFFLFSLYSILLIMRSENSKLEDFSFVIVFLNHWNFISFVFKSSPTTSKTPTNLKNFLTSVSMVVEEESRISFRLLKLFLIAISIICMALLIIHNFRMFLTGGNSNGFDFLMKIAYSLY